MRLFLTSYPRFPILGIGDHCVINRGVYLDCRTGIEIGDNVNISFNVVILTLSHDPDSPDFSIIAGPVKIENDVWIGAGAIILPGVTLARGTVIGAGAVVSKSTNPFDILVGNPARFIRKRNSELRYKTSFHPLYDGDISID